MTDKTQLGKCIRCDKPIMTIGDGHDNPRFAMEGVMRGHYGSRNDCHEFQAWICDDCVPSVTATVKRYLGPSRGALDERRPLTGDEYKELVSRLWDENGEPRAQPPAQE